MGLLMPFEQTRRRQGVGPEEWPVRSPGQEVPGGFEEEQEGREGVWRDGAGGQGLGGFLLVVTRESLRGSKQRGNLFLFILKGVSWLLCRE